MATSFSREEFEMNAGFLEARGYSVGSEPHENPFFVELEGSVNGVVQWGRILYQITS